MWWYADKTRAVRIFTWVLLMVAPVFFTDDETIQIVTGAGIALLGLVLELYWLKIRYTRGIISGAGPKGFSITKGMHTQTITWNEIEELRWEGKNTELVFKKGPWILITTNVSGWEKMLLAAPKDLTGEKYPLIKETLDKDYQKYLACAICGWKAIEAEDNKEGYCEVCSNDQWHKKMAESKEEYIRQCQLEFFSTESADEPVNFDQPQKGFQRVTTWSPLVSEWDVQEYSKSRYWNN